MARSVLFLYLAASLAVVLTVSSCGTSLNADEFINNTVSGRAGEISANLNTSLGRDEKSLAARYLAGVEPVAGEMLRLLDKAAALRVETRASSDSIAASYREVAERSNALTRALGELTPPPPLIVGHDTMLAAYRAQFESASGYAEAVGGLDFAGLKRFREGQEAAASRVRKAHDVLVRDSAPLFKSGRGLRLDRK